MDLNLFRSYPLGSPAQVRTLSVAFLPLRRLTSSQLAQGSISASFLAGGALAAPGGTAKASSSRPFLAQPVRNQSAACGSGRERAAQLRGTESSGKNKPPASQQRIPARPPPWKHANRRSRRPHLRTARPATQPGHAAPEARADGRKRGAATHSLARPPHGAALREGTR